MKKFQEILYLNDENKNAFPKGSVITGYRRQRNIGEIIAPSKPIRDPAPIVEGGCFPCQAPRSCNLHESGVLQNVKYVIYPYDGAWHMIRKHLTCDSRNVVYYILQLGPRNYIQNTYTTKGGRR